MADERIEVEWIATANQMVNVLNKMDARFEKQEATLQKLAATSKKTAEGAAGSFNKLEEELKQNEAALRALAAGTSEFDTQKRKVDELRKAHENAKKAMAPPKEAASMFAGMATSMGTATAAAGALVAGLIKIADAQKQIVSGAVDTIAAIDESARRMQIQAGLTDEQRVQATTQIIGMASNAGVKAEVGFQAATQLAGSGFQDAVDSGALQTILDTIQASSYTGGPDQLVSAFTEALNAYGLDKTNENMKNVAVSAQSLFKQTDFQLVEMGDFAKNASVFKGANLEFSEAMAAFTALREVLPAAESGTGLRNFINKLQQGDITKEQKDNMQRLGINADQVDFVGENLVGVIDSINAATAQLGEAERNAALGKMFGTENVASARLLLQSADRIKELQASQQNADQFMTDRNIAATSITSQRNRIENQALIEQLPIAGRMNELDLENRAREAETIAAQQRMVAEGGVSAVLAPMLPTAVEATTQARKIRDESPLTGAASKAALDTAVPGLSMLFDRLLDTNKKQEEEARKTREAIERLAVQPQQQMPLARPVAQPAVTRPKEAPLPAATVP